MTTRYILDILPEIERTHRNLCGEMSHLIDRSRSWGVNAFETDLQGIDSRGVRIHPSFKHSIESVATNIETEIERINLCIERLIVCRKILEECDSLFDTYVFDEYTVPPLQQLSARVIKENPEDFTLPKHFSISNFSPFLSNNLDAYRTQRKLGIKTKKNRKVNLKKLS